MLHKYIVKWVNNIDICLEQPASNDKERFPLGNGEICALPKGGIWEEEIKLGIIIDQQVVVTQVLNLQFEEGANSTDYCRRLFLNQAIERVDFKTEQGISSREYFISRELNTFFIKITATNGINAFSITLEEQKEGETTKIISNSNKFKLIILDTDGKIECFEPLYKNVKIRRSTYIIIGVSPCNQLVEKRKIYENGYNEIKKLHINRYQEIFERIKFYLGDLSKNNKLVLTCKREDRDTNNSQVNSFFGYCRYLLICFYFKKNYQGIEERIDRVLRGYQSSEEFNSCLEFMSSMLVLNLEECIGNRYERLMLTDTNRILEQAIEKNELSSICNNMEFLFHYIDDQQLLYQVFYPIIKQKVLEDRRCYIRDTPSINLYKELCNKLMLSCFVFENKNQGLKGDREESVYFEKEHTWRVKEQNERLSAEQIVRHITKDTVWNPFSLGEMIPYRLAKELVSLIVEDRSGEIQLLPSLPMDWKSGYLKGIRIERDKMIAIYWENRKVIDFTVVPYRR